MNKDNVPGKEHAELVKARDSYLERSRSRLTVNKGGFDRARARGNPFFPARPSLRERRLAGERLFAERETIVGFFLFFFLSFSVPLAPATGNG